MTPPPEPAAPGGPLEVRRCGPADAAALGAFFEANDVAENTRHFDPFPLTAETARRLCAEPTADRFYVAREGAGIVAFVMLRGWAEGYAVPSFGVLVGRAHQGRGLGGRLTRWALDEAARLGCARVRLSVYADNARGVRAYERAGYVRQEAAALADGRTRVVMVKELARPGGEPNAALKAG